MSWFPKSLVDSLLPRSEKEHGEPEQEEDHESGVKKDITELTDTITRQLWGVASFLAPFPLEQEDPPHVSEKLVGDSLKLFGIRKDFAEIGGSFKTGLSLLSTHKAVSEISRLASSFLQPEDDNEENLDDGLVGVTKEVLEFANNIAMHPETWLEFPLLVVEENFDNFQMSDAQQEHALAVEQLAPRLASLKIELCPSHMSEMCFWKIYFILLHPRLDRSDSELLSTSQESFFILVMDARGIVLQEELQNQARTQSQNFMPASPSIKDNALVQEYCIKEENTQVQEKQVLIDNVKETNLALEESKENGDQEENGETGTPCNTGKQLGAEDISFSDLEDNDSDGLVGKMSLRCLNDSRVSPSSKGFGEPRSRERNSAGEDSSGDWVDVNDFDFEIMV